MPGQRCRDLCKGVQARKKRFSASPYAEGLKKCTVCAIYLKTSSKYCPCCNYLLRTRARSKKSKMFSEILFGGLGDQFHQLETDERDVEIVHV